MSWHWFEYHQHQLPWSARIADAIAGFIGSWTFIIAQTAIFALWVIVNTVWLFQRYVFDPFPFILFNLVMSAQAAYASPLILMAQNRQAERDRIQAQHDYEVNLRAKEEIEDLQRAVARIEIEKLDRIIALLSR